MKKGLIILLVVLGVIGIGIFVIVPLIATPVVLDTVDDAKKSAARSEASMVVSAVNNYCAMQEQLNGENNICSDGVTKEEVSQISSLSYIELISINYDSKVTDLVIKSQGFTVTYDESAKGDKYTVTK